MGYEGGGVITVIVSLFRKRCIYICFGFMSLVFLTFLMIENKLDLHEQFPKLNSWNSLKDEIHSSINYAIPVPAPKNPNQGSRCEVGIITDPEDVRFYNTLLEDEALQYESCNDVKQAASPIYSKVVLVDQSKTTYQIGEVILARVELYDGYGKRKSSGGDLVRASIHSTKGKKYHAPGVVTDNYNGTYTVEIKAFWNGSSVINITLAHTRETVTAVYRIRTKILSTRDMYAQYKSGKYAEIALCHPNHTRLLEATNNTPICNMTYQNYGMPFYCVKPKDVHLLCNDWMQISAKTPFPALPLTECERQLFKRIHAQLHAQVFVTIDDQQLCHVGPTTPCSEYDVTKTWTSREPTGYFSGDNWNFVHCQGISKESTLACMRNKRLYMFGDSTIRHWYVEMMSQFKCTTISEPWTTTKWHKETECAIKSIGFKAGWYPHSQPFCVGTDWNEARHTQISIAHRIDSIPADEHAIVVIHIYMHQLAFHYTVAQGRYRIIRQAVERLFKRNKHAVVLIKAPHTFSDSPGETRLNDCNAELFTKILYDTFKGLHDRIVLLNNKDATIAAHTAWNHPPKNIIAAMLNQMFSFACQQQS